MLVPLKFTYITTFFFTQCSVLFLTRILLLLVTSVQRALIIYHSKEYFIGMFTLSGLMAGTAFTARVGIHLYYLFMVLYISIAFFTYVSLFHISNTLMARCHMSHLAGKGWILNHPRWLFILPTNS